VIFKKKKRKKKENNKNEDRCLAHPSLMSKVQTKHP
jgi:hypothetical protein